MRNKDFKQVLLFFTATLFFSFFVFWGPIAVFQVPAAGFGAGAVGPVWAILLFIVGGFVPSIAGIVLTAVFDGKKQAKQLLGKAFQVKIGLKWFGAICLTTPFYAVAWVIIYSASGGSFKFSSFLTQLPNILPLFVLGPLSEEYGWRGFALRKLLKTANPNTASLAIGIVWSLWHLPLFYMIGTSQHEQNLSFLTFAICVISSSFVYTYFYIKPNQNLFSSILIHWIYTFLYGVVSGGITRSDTYNSLEFIPALLVGFVLAFIMRTRNEDAKIPHTFS